MSALASISPAYQINKKATSASAEISVTARIDYNLRFAKQAVLVVGNNTEQYSQLASQFLVSLSNSQQEDNRNHINVAFLPASTKLNDIQVRCRLVEQLFVNTLFDPEQSLAVSVLRFANQHKEAISIVIDHAQALSLQMQYELSQLVSLAKKNNLVINVVLFGLIENMQLLAVNKSLFKNKLVVIDANSGQVLALEENKSLKNRGGSSLAMWQKLTLVGTMAIITAMLIWVYWLIVEDVNQKVLGQKAQVIKLSNDNTNDQTGNFVVSSDVNTVQELQKKHKIKSVEESLTINTITKSQQATSEDVVAALLVDATTNKLQEKVAQADDVLQALVVADSYNQVISSENIAQGGSTESQLVEVSNNQLVSTLGNPAYYQAQALAHVEGYVVQIAGFSDLALWERFVVQFSTADLHSYQRSLDGKSFMVVTSKVFNSKEEAKAAIGVLPAQLIGRNPWLKSISAVISEINTFTP